MMQSPGRQRSTGIRSSIAFTRARHHSDEGRDPAGVLGQAVALGVEQHRGEVVRLPDHGGERGAQQRRGGLVGDGNEARPQDLQGHGVETPAHWRVHGGAFTVAFTSVSMQVGRTRIRGCADRSGPWSKNPAHFPRGTRHAGNRRRPRSLCRRRCEWTRSSSGPESPGRPPPCIWRARAGGWSSSKRASPGWGSSGRAYGNVVPVSKHDDRRPRADLRPGARPPPECSARRRTGAGPQPPCGVSNRRTLSRRRSAPGCAHATRRERTETAGRPACRERMRRHVPRCP